MGHWLRRATGRRRDAVSDRQLARWLVVVAGAANAGGFMAVGRYTSHMTGIVSAMADDVALAAGTAFLAGLGSLGAFLAGAGVSAILVNLARRRGMQGEYALPLALESLLLAGFAASGPLAAAAPGATAAATVALLCFVMGLQNAVISKLSGARIRTTHVTGMATDLGIELGKAAWRLAALLGRPAPAATPSDPPPVRPDLEKLRTHGELIGLFFGSGLAGALAFQRFGVAAALPLAAIAGAFAAGPLWEDLRRRA
ncbi:YoaK family protein [uncultured Albimonas sp.]|uniref:YoaK family protein n=1 Tax=uncultured Albimonas sp. TaxID=1331701 RepID=UPI0030EB1C67